AASGLASSPCTTSAARPATAASWAPAGDLPDTSATLRLLFLPPAPGPGAFMRCEPAAAPAEIAFDAGAFALVQGRQAGYQHFESQAHFGERWRAGHPGHVGCGPSPCLRGWLSAAC